MCPTLGIASGYQRSTLRNPWFRELTTKGSLFLGNYLWYECGDTKQNRPWAWGPSLGGVSSERQVLLQTFGGESSEMTQLFLLPIGSAVKVWTKFLFPVDDPVQSELTKFCRGVQAECGQVPVKDLHHMGFRSKPLAGHMVDLVKTGYHTSRTDCHNFENLRLCISCRLSNMVHPCFCRPTWVNACFEVGSNSFPMAQESPPLPWTWGYSAKKCLQCSSCDPTGFVWTGVSSALTQ